MRCGPLRCATRPGRRKDLVRLSPSAEPCSDGHGAMWGWPSWCDGRLRWRRTSFVLWPRASADCRNRSCLPTHNC